MYKKTHSSAGGIVYSTDPNFITQKENEQVTPSVQQLLVYCDRRHRAGKTVTVIEGFMGKEDDLEKLGKELRNHCGTGGSAKDGIILLQGDQKTKTEAFLQKRNFKVRLR